MDYTKTTNTVPTYGEESASTLALQQSLNAQNAGMAGWTPLAEDGKYGPLTQAGVEYKAPNPGIVSSTATTNSLATGSAALDTMTSTMDPYMEYLQNKANTLMTTPSQPGIDEQNAAQVAGREQQEAANNYAAYEAGLQTLGIKSGLGRYAPELQADRMLNAANAEARTLQDIQDREDFAIAKAKQARLDNDAATLSATLDEIRQIKQDKANELAAQLDKRTQDIQVAESLAVYANNALASLPPEQQEAFLLQLAKDNNISVLALQGAMANATYADSIRKKDSADTPSDYTWTSEDIKGEFSDSELFDMALASGIDRKVNLSKGNEVNEFLTSSTVLGLGALIDAGYSASDILTAIENGELVF
jgi:hypothetical protein